MCAKAWIARNLNSFYAIMSRPDGSISLKISTLIF